MTGFTSTCSTLLLLLSSSSVLGFSIISSPSSSSSSLSSSHTISKTPTAQPFSTSLHSSLSDGPSPLQEEEDSSSNDPFDTYVLGSNNGSIVTKDTVVGSENDIVAEIDDVITVSLVGTIIQNKKEFLNNEMYTFKLGGGNTFPGFNDGLIGCKVGTKRLIKVPPNKAYGKKGAKGIPPMSDLLFDVEVKGVARGPVERIIATIGTDRLLPSLGLIALLAISPFLPS